MGDQGTASHDLCSLGHNPGNRTPSSPPPSPGFLAIQFLSSNKPDWAAVKTNGLCITHIGDPAGPGAELEKASSILPATSVVSRMELEALAIPEEAWPAPEMCHSGCFNGPSVPPEPSCHPGRPHFIVGALGLLQMLFLAAARCYKWAPSPPQQRRKLQLREVREPGQSHTA